MGLKPRQRSTGRFLSSTASPLKYQYRANKGGEYKKMAHYETTDIFKGAFLLSNGGNLSGISFNDRQVATFTLTGKNLQQLDSDYHSGLALVNPVILRESLNHLRDILFEMKDRRRRNTRNDRTATNRYHQAIR